MPRFFFDFDSDPTDPTEEEPLDFPTLEAAVVAAAASLSLTLHDSGLTESDTAVIIADGSGPKMRLRLLMTVEPLA